VANVIAATAHSGLSALYGAGTDKGIGWKPSHLKPEFFEKQRGGEEHIAIILMMRRINWSRQPQQTMLTRSRISSAKPVKAATTTFVFAINKMCACWKSMDRFPVFLFVEFLYLLASVHVHSLYKQLFRQDSLKAC
jgi:hypothetical protein